MPGSRRARQTGAFCPMPQPSRIRLPVWRLTGTAAKSPRPPNPSAFTADLAQLSGPTCGSTDRVCLIVEAIDCAEETIDQVGHATV